MGDMDVGAGSLQMLRTLTSVVSAMEEGVSERDPAVRSARITELAKLIETVYDDDAAMLGDFLRECGGIDLLIEYMSDKSIEVRPRAATPPARAPRPPRSLSSSHHATRLNTPQVKQRALMVLGNLVSDAVDPESHLTKQLFVQTPAASDALLPLLEHRDWVTQMYAAACCQASHRIASHRIASHRIASHRTA
jgi:hypothetical protein